MKKITLSVVISFLAYLIYPQTVKAQLTLTTSGTSGPATLSGTSTAPALNIPQYSNLFNSDGTLTGNRVINQNGYKFQLSDAQPFMEFVPAAYSGNYKTQLGSISGTGHLIFGNNGINYIQAGTTGTGGQLDIYTNCTNNLPSAPNGIRTMNFAPNGNVTAFHNLTVMNDFAVNGSTQFGSAYFGLETASQGLAISSSTTNAKYMTFQNNGGRSFVGVESSVAGAGLLYGSSPYALCISTESNNDIYFGTNNHAKLAIKKDGALEGSDDYSAQYDGNSYIQKAYADAHYQPKTGGSSGMQSIQQAGQQLSLNYDETHTTAFTTGSTGNFTIAPSGGTMAVTGMLGIGTADTHGFNFAVNGTAIATALTLKVYSDWPDYVFNPTYRLPSLKEVKSFIDKNQHLPEMPSETEMVKNGLNVGEMNKLLTKKVEELTLYLIEKDKQLADQQKQLSGYEDRLKRLEDKLK